MKELLKQKLNSNPSDCKKKKRLSAAQHCFALNVLLPPPLPLKNVSNGKPTISTLLQLQPCIAAFFV